MARALLEVRITPAPNPTRAGQEATSMATFRVLSARGDTAIEWDQQQAAAGDPEALAAISEAERIFAEQRARGATAFRIAAGRPAERLDRFDPAAEQVVVVPRVAGG